VIAIEPAALARVRGGDAAPAPSTFPPGMNTEALSTKLGGGARSLTDYGYCAATVKESCHAANPGRLWGTNDAAAATCTLTRLPQICGTPPLPQP